jgi:putative spermidine/putrescine transport system permease protein
MSVGVARPGGGAWKAAAGPWTAGTGARALLAPPLALLVVGVGVPIVAAVIKATGSLGASGVFTKPIDDAGFRRAIVITLALAALTTAVAVVVGVVYALALAIAAPRWARVLTAVLLLTFWISLLVRTYGWLLALQPNGALDYVASKTGVTHGGLGLFQTLPGLVLPMVHIMLPYMVLPVYASARNIDLGQVRAGRSLGGSATLVLRRVVFPALRPGILAGSVIVFILSVGFYVTPSFLGSPHDRVVAVVVGEVFGRGQRDLPLASAMGVLLLIAVLLVYFLADRLLRIGEHLERF